MCAVPVVVREAGGEMDSFGLIWFGRYDMV